jgi:hypothetical protein
MDVDTRQLGPNPSANHAVARVKRSIWGGSYIGVMGIDKRSGNRLDAYNQTTGADTRLVFFKNLAVSAFAAQTRTPGVSSGQTDVGAGLNYQSNWLELFAQHRKVGPNFNPEVGFLERTDCICDYLDSNFKFRPKIRSVRELNFEGFIFHAPDTHHVLQTQEWQGTFRIEFNNGSYSDDDIVDVFTQRLCYLLTSQRAFSSILANTMDAPSLTYGTSQAHRFAHDLRRFGTYYDGRLNEARVRGTYRANERLSFALGEQWNRFRLPTPGGNFSVLVGSFQTNYSFSRFLTLSSLIQMDTANTQAVSANLRLRWNYRPDSDLYVIYNGRHAVRKPGR